METGTRFQRVCSGANRKLACANAHSCPAAFPCGRKQSELLYWARSPWNQSALLGAIRTPAHNRTEEQLMALNASQPQHAGNQTAEPMTPRVVGGYLEEQGGSPWQVSPHGPVSETPC